MRTLLISLMAVGLFAASSCVNEGGQVFGELPEGVVPVSGEALEARGAVYNKDLNELKISWRTTPDPKLYKGVEVSFQALGGQSKTIRITLNIVLNVKKPCRQELHKASLSSAYQGLNR